jgi:thymidylate kinase
MTITRVSPGQLIVFEGPDGVGKTTIAARYADLCRNNGDSVFSLSFPGREPGSLGSVIYDIHHDPGKFGISVMTPESLQTLHVAAHLDAIDRYVRPAVARGETVILDRYWWSTWVYGVDCGASRSTIDALIDFERLHWGSLAPDVVILITRDESLRPEESELAWSRRLALYRTVADREQSRYPVQVISNDTTEDDLLDRIVDTVEHLREQTMASVDRPSTSNQR